MSMYLVPISARNAGVNLRQSVVIPTLFFAANPVLIRTSAGRNTLLDDTRSICAKLKSAEKNRLLMPLLKMLTLISFISVMEVSVKSVDCPYIQ